MIGNLARKLLLFIPSLLLISLFVFFLGQLSPGSSIDQILEEVQEKNQNTSLEEQNREIERYAAKYGLDLPPFYFSLKAQSDLTSNCSLANRIQEQGLSQMAFDLGDSEALCSFYFLAQKKMELLDSESAKIVDQSFYFKSLKELKAELKRLPSSVTKELLLAKAEELRSIKKGWKNHLPKITWNGTKNQYHQWISKMIQGDLGLSLYDGRKVSSKISTALKWTLSLSLIALLLAIVIAIPCGVYAAFNEGGVFDRLCSNLFFGLHALPNFWVATLLIVFFSNPDFLNWFPNYGLGDIDSASSLAEIFSIRASHLVLPLFCWTYGSLAYLFRQIRKSMIQELNSDYVKTAKAKGLSTRDILWKHAFKNASFPLITMAGAVLPQLFSGAFVIEYIFSIPGMGSLSMNALLSRDFPTLYSIVMIIAVLTLIGIFLSDLWYQKADPRIRILVVEDE